MWLLIILVIIGASVSYAASQCGDNSCTLPNIIAQKVNGTAFYDTDNTSYYIDPASSEISGFLAGSLGIGTTPKYRGDVNGSFRVGGNPQGGASSGYGIEFHPGTGTNQIYAYNRNTVTALPLSLQETGGNLIIGSNTIIGASTFPSGGGTPQLVMAQAGSAPTGFASNTGGMVVLDLLGTAEVYLCDEAANCAIQTPHANDFLNNLSLNYYYPWVYESSNPYLGRKITVDMEGVVRAIENLAGKQFIFTENITKLSWAELENWRESEENALARNRTIDTYLRNATDIKILANEAFETVTETKTITTDQVIGYNTEYSYDENGTVISTQVPVFKTKTISKSKKQLKENVRFDKEIGKFYKKPTRAEAEAAIGENYPHYMKQQPPQWMAVRGVN